MLENRKRPQMRENFIADTKAALKVEFRVLQLYVQKIFQVKGSWQRNPATKPEELLDSPIAGKASTSAQLHH